MTDNGKQALEMTIKVDESKALMVSFPFLDDKILTYGFLKMAEKTLDEHYKSKIVQPKGGIMDFARRKK